jgi:hypothetical protein
MKSVTRIATIIVAVMVLWTTVLATADTSVQVLGTTGGGIVNLGSHTTANAPACTSALVLAQYYNTTIPSPMQCNGTTWQPVAPACTDVRTTWIWYGGGCVAGPAPCRAQETTYQNTGTTSILLTIFSVHDAFQPTLYITIGQYASQVTTGPTEKYDGGAYDYAEGPVAGGATPRTTITISIPPGYYYRATNFIPISNFGVWTETVTCH